MIFTEHNPYYSPERCGLSIFYSIDTADSYEFDMLVIWKRISDNTLWWDQDSGCSCPIPFDVGRHDIRPLTLSTRKQFNDIIKGHLSISDQEIVKLKLKDHFKK